MYKGVRDVTIELYNNVIHNLFTQSVNIVCSALALASRSHGRVISKHFSHWTLVANEPRFWRM
jgi:hypothetical protein